MTDNNTNGRDESDESRKKYGVRSGKDTVETARKAVERDEENDDGGEDNDE